MRTLLEHRVAGLALLSPLMPTKELRSLTASWPTVLVGRDAVDRRAWTWSPPTSTRPPAASSST